MNLVTLNTFLQGPRDHVEADSQSAPDRELRDASCRMLAAISASILAGEPFADLRDQLKEVEKECAVQTGSRLMSANAVRVEEILCSYRDRLRQIDEDRTAEFRQGVNLLNEMISHLMANSETSEGRRQQLESNLAIASRMDNLTALRSHLSKVLREVKEEGRREKERAQEVIGSFGEQIRQVNEAESRFISHLPDRQKAIEFLTPIWREGVASSELYVAIVIASSLPAIRARHGEDTARLVINDLGRKLLAPLFKDGSVFCWSLNSLVLIWHHTNESGSPGNLSSRLTLPYEHRAFLGSRTAVFSIMLGSLVVQARDTLEELVSSLDSFAKRGGR